MVNTVLMTSTIRIQTPFGFDSTAAGNAPSGVAPYALDAAAAERLWELSLTTVRA